MIKHKSLTTILIVIIISILIALSFKFIVKQGDEAVILRLGEIIENNQGQVIEYKPGIHFRVPLLDTVKKFDMRNRILEADSSRVVTKEQKDVLINAYLVWNINDISKFYRSTSGNMDRADTLLKQFLESTLRAQVGKIDIQNLINNDRDSLMIALTASIDKQAKQIGVDIIDVRVKQIDLPETVTDSIYQRMKSSRHKVAASIRAEGSQLSEKIQAAADAKVTVTMAKAERDSKNIKAEADAKAAKIFADTYSQSSNFYKFLKSMESYNNSFDQKDKENVFVIQPKGKFFDNFKATLKTSTVK